MCGAGTLDMSSGIPHPVCLEDILMRFFRPRPNTTAQV
jgi:hypothetical protein